jgi:UDP-2,3-diacylglucosamine pyrophosphatase LpxH
LLIFVSDLHLVDHPRRASFQALPFLRAIDSIVGQSDFREDPVTLVLLGDIFEVLKSADRRPRNPSM